MQRVAVVVVAACGVFFVGIFFVWYVCGDVLKLGCEVRVERLEVEQVCDFEQVCEKYIHDVTVFDVGQNDFLQQLLEFVEIALILLALLYLRQFLAQAVEDAQITGRFPQVRELRFYQSVQRLSQCVCTFVLGVIDPVIDNVVLEAV